MVEPRADQVDFAEIADQMADIARYAGAADPMVSIANHTLIADRVAVTSGATPRLRALVLLHDQHETRIGETPTPATHARIAIATQMFGLPVADALRQVFDEEKRRHDRAIHEAAGIAMPTADEKLFIHHCDIVALATEKRDFLARPAHALGEGRRAGRAAQASPTPPTPRRRGDRVARPVPRPAARCPRAEPALPGPIHAEAGMNKYLAFLDGKRQAARKAYAAARRRHAPSRSIRRAFVDATADMLRFEIEHARALARAKSRAGTLAGDLDLFLSR